MMNHGIHIGLYCRFKNVVWNRNESSKLTKLPNKMKNRGNTTIPMM